MAVLFEREYYLRMSDFDCYGRMRPSGIMDLFQDAASAHAEELGCGFGDMIKRDMLWVIVRLKFEVISQPQMFSKVRVKTWPLAPSRAGFRREYLIENEQGGVLVKGSSDWVIMHSQLRKLMPAKDIYSTNDDFLTLTNFEGRLEKLHDFEGDGEPFKVHTQHSDLDRNMHVNNIKYMDFVFNAIEPKEGDCLRTIQVDYRKEVLADSNLFIVTKAEDKSILAKGVDENGETMFVCKTEIN